MIQKTGFRKTARAVVMLHEDHNSNDIVVNNKKIEDYFYDLRLLKKALSPLKLLDLSYKIKIKVHGSGTSSQAEAVRYSISRAIATIDEKFKDSLKRVGFLTGRPEQVERKKVGLIKARKKAPYRRR